MQSHYTGLHSSYKHRTIRILLCSLPTQDCIVATNTGLSGSCPDPPVQSPYTGLHSSYKHRTIRILLSSPKAPIRCPEDLDCPDPPVESRGWTQPLHSVRRIRTVRILLSSPEAGHSPYTASGGSGLSGSSCRVPRLDTAPTQRPEDPDCPDPPVESRGWTQPLHSVRRIRTVRILLCSPEDSCLNMNINIIC